MSRRVFVVGAGVAGLAAAVQAQRRGARVVLIEAAPNAGGRSRSYFDARLGATVDNGSHLLLSGNHSTLAYLRTIGSADNLAGPTQPDYPFFDAHAGDAWTIRISPGRLPRWIFDADARVPATQPADYLQLLPLFFAKPGRTIEQSMRASGRVWDRLARPLLRALLNADPSRASATLAANMLRETLVAGGQACRPLVARNGLAHAFVEPALRLLQYGGAEIRLGARVAAIGLSGTDSRERVSSLAFDNAGEPVSIEPGDGVVLAVTPDAARRLVPDVAAPDEFRAIATVHFAVDVPIAFAGSGRLTFFVSGASDWLHASEGRLTATIADADRLLATPHEDIAASVWRDVAKAARMPEAPMPPWQVVVEEQATFAAVPSQEGLRAATRTRWQNLTLAGDWTATGLPATIEGAVRSGQKAADVLMNPSMEY
ncbi:MULTISPECIES: hydroxysqualene dehydroxylase HpnE [unclassified Caballeronia]|uniref:hydroxysqualene dehydroxylase HpnE n=1 Tax=unclassified Caballeronia TaxID=2646786 RepID=UPI00285C84E5|nr:MULTISPECIES: hydroxysqualene dehydroxylase HpnE [unclassified Caballeronia]MDR5738937.1 hydroxysqualene dehydroxylase HpnE [Caballeronia sp. LZ016]MDR5807425.1 hydroxysqualene dehydroxylase HpnE [Caballeronia sp. LZ019]